MTTNLRTRQQIEAEADEARRLVAEAEAKTAAAKAAERELWEAEKAARLAGFQAYRDQVNKAGGINREQNTLAEKFEAAVRAGDGPAVLSAWLAWRFAYITTRGVDDALQGRDSRAYDTKPDFAGDLARTMAKLEAEHRRDGHEKVTAYVEQYVTEALS